MLVHHRIPSMKWLGVLLLPPGWDASPSQPGYPAGSDLEYYFSPQDGMLVHHRIPSMKWLGVSLLPPGLDASPSQDTQHEVTRSITTPPLDGMLVHHRIPSMKCLGVLLLPLVGMLVHHRIPSMKWLGVLLLPPGWDASPSQDSQHEVTWSITSPPWMGC